MTRNTRTAVIVSVGYLVITYWRFDSIGDGSDWERVLVTPVFFLPLAILWGWWFYQRGRRE